ncbi:MAG: hypothetical protein ACO1N1_14380 [Dyadobacter fermentans]
MNTHFIRHLFFCLALLLVGSVATLAQPAFPPTADDLCYNCVPLGYEKVSAAYEPATSSPAYYGSMVGTWVPYNGQTVPDPPSEYSQSTGTITNHFVTLRSANNAQGNVSEAIKATVTGFKPNKNYSFTYSVLSSSLASTTYGKSAKMTVATADQIPIAEDETAFGDSKNVWITKTMTFTASSETLVFILSAGEMDPGSIGFVNFDINDYPFACNAGTGDIPVSQSEVNILCPNTTFDLTTLVSNPPAGIENVWYTDAHHTEANKIADPTAVPAGTYYLFRYDPEYECFNIQASNSKVEVKDLGDVALQTDKLSNACPATSVNLIAQVQGTLPANHVVRWYTTKDRSTPPVQFANSVSTAGTYYAFLLNLSANCFYRGVSEDSIEVTINAPCCQAGTEQVKLISGNINVDCGQTANLNSLLSANNVIPNGTLVVWFATKDRAPGTVVFTPQAVAAGKYYAFIYDDAAKCYNAVTSDAEVTVSGMNGTQVPLDKTTLINQCPAQTVNLHSSYSVTPPAGFQIVFYTTKNHAPGTIVLSNANTTGKYYAFYFNAVTGCFNTDDSKAEVQVVIVDCTPCQVTGSEQVDLKTDSKSNLCPSTTVDLYSTIQNGSIPPGSEVVWFDNPYHWGTALTVVEASSISATKRYYAFLHDIIDVGCYNTGVSESFVDVTINAPCPPVCNAGSNQVSLKPNPATNTCPGTTVNLTSRLEGILPAFPPGLKYTWFDNKHHEGLPLANVNQVAADGDYYVFIYDEVNNCYNTDESTSFVKVILQECKVYTNIKVKLQGAMSFNTDMHNNLRTSGLLPTIDPYNLGSDGPTALVNNITDWVKVEIRSAANPSDILESKSFMLKTDGTLERYSGVSTVLPYFKPAPGPIHIVVRHRNHIAIMSNVIDNFSTGTIDYDFTTSLQQCYNDGSAPVQMTEVNGVWCMSSGDLNGDETLDDADNTSMSSSFHQGTMDQYIPADLNMDGVVDDVDLSLFNHSYYNSLFSIITKY